MKKALLTTAIAVGIGFSGATLAHQSGHDNHMNISSDNCDLKFSNKLSITPNLVSVDAEKGTIKIDQDGMLTINGQPQSVSASDQTLLAQYAESVRVQVPQVADIAMDGVALAGVALKEVGEAFGLENMAGMEELMNDIGEDIQSAFYDGGTFVMEQGRFDSIGDTFDSKFDEQMEEAMEQMMMESIGSILISLGSEMIGSGGSMSEFEQRMERMGEQIEQYVALQAKDIEQKAHQLCYDFEDLAAQEDELQARIPVLKAYDVFTVSALKSEI